MLKKYWQEWAANFVIIKNYACACMCRCC